MVQKNTVIKLTDPIYEKQGRTIEEIQLANKLQNKAISGGKRKTKKKKRKYQNSKKKRKCIKSKKNKKRKYYKNKRNVSKSQKK